MEQQKLPYGIGSIILGVLAILCCCTGLFGGIFGGIGLYLASISRKMYLQNPDLYSNYGEIKAGRILSIIGLVLSLYVIGSNIYQIIQLGGVDAYLEKFQEAFEEAMRQYE